MIKVSVLYPNSAGVRFDHDYYVNTHLPMVQRLMGDHLKGCQFEKGLAGGAPGQPPAYVAVSHLICESVEAFQAGFGPHQREILSDVPNYTNAAPVLQISEIVLA